MATVIDFAHKKPQSQRYYSVDITERPDDLLFTVSGVKISSTSLKKIADELEKIAHIIRTDVMTGAIPTE